MAKKRRRRAVRRAATAKRRSVRRRRRSTAVRAFVAKPKIRRRRRPTVRRSARRRGRSYRSNPSFGLGFLVSAAKDGATIVAGQIATRKLAGLAQQYVPGLATQNADGSKNVIGIVGSRLAAAVVIGFASRKFAPNYSRLLTAAAMAETLSAGLAQTPAAAYLGAMPRMASTRRGFGAYPGTGASAIRSGSSAAGVSGYVRPKIGMPRQVG